MSTELNQEEEIQERAFNLGLTLQLLKYLSPHRGHMVLAFGTIALAAGSGQIGPYLTQVAVDDYIAVGDWEGLRWMIAAFFGSVAVQYGAQYAQTLVTGMIGQRVMYDMRRDLFAHLQKLPLRYFDRTPLGRVMTRATNDIDALNEFFSEGVVSVFMDLFTLLAIIGFHGLYRPRTGPDLLYGSPGHRHLDLLPPGPRHARLSRVAHALGAAQCLFTGKHHRRGDSAALQPPAAQFARLRRRAPALSPRRRPRNSLLLPSSFPSPNCSAPSAWR